MKQLRLMPGKKDQSLRIKAGHFGLAISGGPGLGRGKKFRPGLPREFRERTALQRAAGRTAEADVFRR